MTARGAGFERSVISLARLYGWRVAHFHDSRRVVKRGGRYIAIGDKDAAGWPDLVLVRGTRCLVRELKSGSGRMTAEQKAWVEALAGAGIDAGVWRETDWTLIEQTLKPERAAPLAGGEPTSVDTDDPTWPAALSTTTPEVSP